MAGQGPEEPKEISEAVDAAVDAPGDPIRASLRRWATALAEVGGGVEMLERGYGARYADAVEALAGKQSSDELTATQRPRHGGSPPRRGHDERSEGSGPAL